MKKEKKHYSLPWKNFTIDQSQDDQSREERACFRTKKRFTTNATLEIFSVFLWTNEPIKKHKNSIVHRTTIVFNSSQREISVQFSPLSGQGRPPFEPIRSTPLLDLFANFFLLYPNYYSSSIEQIVPTLLQSKLETRFEEEFEILILSKIIEVI